MTDVTNFLKSGLLCDVFKDGWNVAYSSVLPAEVPIALVFISIQPFMLPAVSVAAPVAKPHVKVTVSSYESRRSAWFIDKERCPSVEDSVPEKNRGFVFLRSRKLLALLACGPTRYSK